MFTWLASLPVIWQTSITLALLFTITIAAVWGKINLAWGKFRLGFGVSKNCENCSDTIRAMNQKLDRGIFRVDHDNLKKKMNNAEQHLLSVQTDLYEVYTNMMRKKTKNDHESDIAEDKELSSYRSKLDIAISLMKDELRRAFKENGYEILNTAQFEEYTMQETQILTDIFERFVGANYPRHMIISSKEVNEIILKYRPKLNTAVHSVFSKAKVIEERCSEDIKALEAKYETDINELINNIKE